MPEINVLSLSQISAVSFLMASRCKSHASYPMIIFCSFQMFLKSVDGFGILFAVSQFVKLKKRLRMTIAIIVITSIIASYSVYRLYTKRESLDESKVLKNRLELKNLASEDWAHNSINEDVYRMLCFVFHPNFRNMWDYIPPEKQAYPRQMYQLDSNFWRSYKLTQDFVIPAYIVYELYKEYISQHINDCFKIAD